MKLKRKQFDIILEGFDQRHFDHLKES